MTATQDVATGEDTGDEIRWVKFSGLAWAKDGSGFYYSRFPEPKEGQAFQSLNENHAVYFHRLGTASAKDGIFHARRGLHQLLGKGATRHRREPVIAHVEIVERQ